MTRIGFHNPRDGRSRPTATSSELPAVARISDAQRRVLVALCRPYATGDGFAVPATNQQVADELFLSVDAVKSHLRALFEKFGIGDVPQNRKRALLVERALTTGMVGERDLRAPRPSEQRPQAPERVGDLRLGDDERGQEAQRARAGGVEHEPLLGQRPPHQLRRVDLELGGDHQARAAHLADARQLAHALGQQRAALAHRVEEGGVVDARRARRWRPRSTSGLPAKVEPWSPGAKTSAYSGAVTSAPIGSPPPRPLASVITSGTIP